MSDIAFNPAPAPELLNTAQAPARARPAAPAPAGGRPADVAGQDAATRDPFAALLAGVLGVSAPAPMAGTAAPATDLASAAADPASPATDPALLIALPGTATTPATPLADLAGGNALPAGGNSLPLPVPVGGDEATALGGTSRPAAGTPTPPAESPRVFLADLALSRPVDPGLTATATPATTTAAEPPPATPRSAPAVLAEGLADVASRSRAGTPASTATVLATTPAAAASATAVPLVAGGAERLALRLAGLNAAQNGGGIVVPAVPATDALASQLAAFAATADAGTTRVPTGTATSAAVATDASGLALNGRAAGTLLLQPLAVTGDAGAFAGGLADRLVNLGGAGTHSARLKLHPESLGELDVEITMDDGTAQVWFGTANSQARDAIQESLPRLRELFAEQGIQLTRTQVDTGGGATANPGFGQERRMTGSAGGWSEAPGWLADRGVATPATAAARATAPSRLLDVWA